jgi:protein phosphatase
MGGAASGELASSMGSAFLLEAVLAQWTPVPPAVDTFVEVLRDATVDANQRLHRYAVAHPEHRGMGTTLTAAGVLDDQLYLVQVGDSRGYLVRDGVARQLTKDQSLIQRLVELGELTAEQAEASTRRNIILQALGPEAQVVVDLTHQPLRDGDLLLLCSDGLSGLVSPDELAALAAAHEDEAALCEALVAQANARGGHDNITVVVARFHGEGLGPAQPGDAVGYAVYPLAGTLNDGSVPTALSPALGAQLRADPTPRFGTPVPSPEVIAQARAAQAAVREAPTVAGGVAAIREPVATVAAETARLEERRARALPIQVALGLLGAAALLWALANLLQR